MAVTSTMQSIRAIGETVRFHRKKSGLSQAGLAKMAGVGKTAVFDVEKGKESVQMDTLLKILSVLNIRLELKSPLMAAFSREGPCRGRTGQDGP